METGKNGKHIDKEKGNDQEQTDGKNIDIKNKENQTEGNGKIFKDAKEMDIQNEGNGKDKNDVEEQVKKTEGNGDNEGLKPENNQTEENGKNNKENLENNQRQGNDENTEGTKPKDSEVEKNENKETKPKDDQSEGKQKNGNKFHPIEVNVLPVKFPVQESEKQDNEDKKINDPLSRNTTQEVSATNIASNVENIELEQLKTDSIDIKDQPCDKEIPTNGEKDSSDSSSSEVIKEAHLTINTQKILSTDVNTPAVDTTPIINEDCSVRPKDNAYISTQSDPKDIKKQYMTPEEEMFFEMDDDDFYDDSDIWGDWDYTYDSPDHVSPIEIVRNAKIDQSRHLDFKRPMSDHDLMDSIREDTQLGDDDLPYEQRSIHEKCSDDVKDIDPKEEEEHGIVCKHCKMPFTSLRHPRVLPCGHNICSKCSREPMVDNPVCKTCGKLWKDEPCPLVNLALLIALEEYRNFASKEESAIFHPFYNKQVSKYTNHYISYLNIKSKYRIYNDNNPEQYEMFMMIDDAENRLKSTNSYAELYKALDFVKMVINDIKSRLQTGRRLGLFHQLNLLHRYKRFDWDDMILHEMIHSQGPYYCYYDIPGTSIRLFGEIMVRELGIIICTMTKEEPRSHCTMYDYEEIKLCFEKAPKLVFLDFFQNNTKKTMELFIEIQKDNVFGRQFLYHCTGERGTNFLDCRANIGPNRHLFVLHYNGLDGKKCKDDIFEDIIDTDYNGILHSIDVGTVYGNRGAKTGGLPTIALNKPGVFSTRCYIGRVFSGQHYFKQMKGDCKITKTGFILRKDVYSKKLVL